MSDPMFGITLGEWIGITIDGAILLFVVYDFFIRRRNRPHLELEITKPLNTGEGVYAQEWIISNVGHDTALNVEGTFELRGDDSPYHEVTILVKHFPISRKGSMAPENGNDWLGLSLLIVKGSKMFSLVSRDEEVKDSKITTVTHTDTLPVGKYLVWIQVSGDNLRDEDRTHKPYVLEFPDGLPKMRPVEKGEPVRARMETVALIDTRSKSPSPSPESSQASSSSAPSQGPPPAPG
jgi:hypothetical protein